MKLQVSIIIVKYKSDQYLRHCLKSIDKNPKWEKIIIDNDRKNIGFAAACNQGAQKAKGNFLFFLNPDTLILDKALEKLTEFLRTHSDFAIVAPMLLDKDKKPYPLQGTDELTPLSAIFSLSFLNKLFPQNPISKKYWLLNGDKKSIREVAVIPGSAFMIKKEIFEEVGGFDENFFLYFEESDLCRRIKKKNLKMAILPKAMVIHFWAKSTPKDKKIKKIFQQSRYYYFKKHFGFFKAFLVELFLRGGEWSAPLF